MRRATTLLAYATCCVLWGSTWAVIKIGLVDLPPLYFAAVRMLLACVLLTPFALKAGLGSLGGGRWKALVLVGTLNLGLPFALLFAGQQHVPSGLAAVFFATFPVWMVLLGRLFLDDQPLTLPRLAAGPLGLAGIAVIQSPHLRGVSVDKGFTLGAAFVIAAAILIAVANVIQKRTLLSLPPAVAVWGQTGVGAAVIGLLSLSLEPGQAAHWTPRAVSAMAYLVVFGTVVTNVTLFWLLPRVPMAAIGALPLLDTLVAVSLGAAMLHEPLGWRFAAAAGLVLAAAALANLSSSPGKAPAPAPAAPPPRERLAPAGEAS